MEYFIHYGDYERDLSALRDWPLITGREGLQNGNGGQVKFYPYKKGGGRKKL